MKILLSTFFVFVLSVCGVSAQATIDPPTATQDDTVTVTFDATQGDRGLLDCDCDVYLHTGLITSASTSGSDWMFVPTVWGEVDDAWRMTPVGPNVYAIDIDIRGFYGFPAGTTVESLAFVFRDANGSRAGRADSGTDIFVPLSPSSDPDPEPDPDPNPNPDPNPDPDPNPNPNPGDPQPTGPDFGYTDLPDAGGIVKLLAPLRSEAYVLGTFNDFQVQERYKMTPLPDGSGFEYELPASITDEDFAYQYVVDGSRAFADPFSDLVLDPPNDVEIEENTFPGIPTFDNLNGKASWVRRRDFDWRNDDTARQPAERLVIYELLVRDFVAAHDFQTVLDSLDYLANLGITAIELMPVNEFEFNNSWGYNPIFHGAIDKYYGTPESLKRLIDAAHGRGIRVLFDVVYNHAFSQNPWVGLYRAETDASPDGAGPFFNRQARHPFNVGVDFNHESPYTKLYVGQTLRKIFTEYHIDGVRFDLTKGFTQRFSANNEELSVFDQGRVDILKGYADSIRSVKPDALIILEHFGSNAEETVLKDDGLYLWGGADFQFAQNVMGYEEESDLYSVTPQSRGWDRGLVGYMESHDQQRQRYKALEFGNANEDGSYSTRDSIESLARMEATTVMLYTGPGTRMLWQFGELGYPVPLLDETRTDRKPILWELFQQPANRQLYDVTAAMIKLRTIYPVFTEGEGDFEAGLNGGLTKSLTLTHPELDVVAIANFDVVPQTIGASFLGPGTYYDYFTGESFEIAGTGEDFPLAPGDYRLLTSERLPSPEMLSSTGSRPPLRPLNTIVEVNVYPNPTRGTVKITVSDGSVGRLSVELFNSVGQLVGQDESPCCELSLRLAGLAAGTYTALVKTASGQAAVRRVVRE